MKTRSFKNENLSQLGFGLMRLPVLDGDESKIDKEAASEMLKEAIASGVNYLDTAYPYHKGESEPFLGEFLEENGLRDRINIATKLPAWLVEKPEDMDRFLDEQLKRLRTDHIDFYLLHALDGQRIDVLKQNHFEEFLDRAKASVKIRYAGFSFHDDYEAFEKILESYPFDFCQIQLNYMDEDYQAGLKGLKKASEMGLGVMIMEPLRGGMLSGKPEGRLEEIWSESQVEETPASLALRYLWNEPEVTLVLSGMSTLEQVRENLATADLAQQGDLSKAEKDLIRQIRTFYESRLQVPCTGCLYCIDCPEKIPIAQIFKYWNEDAMYGESARAKQRYQGIDSSRRPENCISCGSCESHCPQHIPIIEKIQEARKDLE